MSSSIKESIYPAYTAIVLLTLAVISTVAAGQHALAGDDPCQECLPNFEPMPSNPFRQHDHGNVQLPCQPKGDVWITDQPSNEQLGRENQRPARQRSEAYEATPRLSPQASGTGDLNFNPQAPLTGNANLNAAPQQNQFSINPLAQTGRGGARSRSLGAPGLLGDLFNAGTSSTVTIQPPSFTERFAGSVQVGSFRLFRDGDFSNTFDFDDSTNGQQNNGVFDPGETLLNGDNGLQVIAPTSPGDMAPIQISSSPGQGPPIRVDGVPSVSVSSTTFTTVDNIDAINNDFNNNGVSEFPLETNSALGSDAVQIANAAPNLQPGQPVSANQNVATMGPDLSTSSVSVSNARAQTLDAADVQSPAIENGSSLLVLFDVTAQPLVDTTPEPIVLTIPSPGGAPGANVGRQKLTENSSPVPQDRFIHNFSYFDNTPLIPAGQNVSRHVFGFEKTFYQKMLSLEFRVPFASTLNSNLTASSAGGTFGGSDTEFGNLTLYIKSLLTSNDNFALGAGLGIALPTAEDFSVSNELGTTLLKIESESTHLLPYIGFVFTPNPKFFTQGLVQLDLDTRGNSALVTGFSSIDGTPTGELSNVGRLQDSDFIFVDIGMGYWLFRDQTRHARGITGFAPTFEVHYNGDIDSADQLSTSLISTNDAGSFDLVNLLVGGIVEFGANKQLLLGYSTPAGGDEQFDGEFRASFNWFFGSSPRAPSF